MNASPDSCTLDSSLLERAQQAFVDADWPAAAAALTEALHATPASSELTILLGHARLNGKDPVGALEAYQACARMAPNQSVVHACCAMALQMLARTQEAGAAADRALALDAADGIALKVKARLAIDAGDVPGATHVCQTLMKLFPEDADVKRLADDCLAMPAVRAIAKPAPSARAGTVVGPASLFGDYSTRAKAWARLGCEHLTHQFVVDDFDLPVEAVTVPPAQAFASDGFAVPPASLTMGYGAGDLNHYIQCGQTSYGILSRILRERNVTLGAGDAMLDWGCASGRVVRNFGKEAAAGCEVWGGDVHSPSIRWAQAHLSPTFKFFNSSSQPHLPFPDGKFKFIYGFSVFTHLNTLRDLWLLELRRVLADDGMLLLTVHNEDTWRWFRSKGMPAWMPKSLRGHEEMPGECVEIRGDRWEHCYTLFSNDYLKRTWGPYFEGFEIIPCADSYQSAVILRKRAVRAAATPAVRIAAPQLVPVAPRVELAPPAAPVDWAKATNQELKSHLRNLLGKVGFRRLQQAGFHVQGNDFYSPLNDVDFLEANPDLWTNPPLTPPNINWRMDEQLTVARELAPFIPELADVPPEPAGNHSRFAWNNNFWQSADALAHYGLVRARKPKRYVEIGCGWSSLLLKRALELNRSEGHDCAVTLIEPYPNQSIFKHLPSEWTIHRQMIQRADLAIYDQLEAGDVLFYDGSHCSKVASDVNWFFFHVLPRLKPGVLIHIHDIMLPQDYPKDWIFERGQTWNEQYVLQAFLMHNDAYRITLANRFLFVHQKAELERLYGKIQPVYGCSFWMEKVSS